MIPVFPVFTKLTLAHKSVLAQYTNTHKPYSSFNHTNVYAWDIHGTRKISLLHNNLVFFFTDYVTGAPFLSFLGPHKPITTAIALLHYLQQNNEQPVLRFITKETAKKLAVSKKLVIEKDEINSDYIFSTYELGNLAGKKYKKKRSQVNAFQKANHNINYTIKDLSDASLQKQLLDIFSVWEDYKCQNGKACETAHEKRALIKLMESATDHDLVLSCLYVENTLVAFSIEEILPKRQAIGHFIKADPNYRGVFEYINLKIAQYLYEHNVLFWNWQQDLGIPGLRAVKLSYRPVAFLEKYTITFSPNQQPINS